jgi:hypothetical protein
LLLYQKIYDTTALGRGTVPAMHRSGSGVGASLLRKEDAHRLRVAVSS